MASLTRWTWVWVNSRSWWWTGRPGVLRFMGSQRVGHDWATELNWRILGWPLFSLALWRYHSIISLWVVCFGLLGFIKHFTVKSLWDWCIVSIMREIPCTLYPGSPSGNLCKLECSFTPSTMTYIRQEAEHFHHLKYPSSFLISTAMSFLLYLLNNSLYPLFSIAILLSHKSLIEIKSYGR